MDDAVVFNRHFTVTSPCGPSRASLMTGLYAMNHRSVRNGTPLDANRTTVAREMRTLGYDPTLFGYTDTTIDPRHHHPADPLLRSYETALPDFNEKLEMRFEQSYPWRAHLLKQGYSPPDYSEFYYPQSAEGNAPVSLGDPAFFSAADSETAFLTDAVLDYLKIETSDTKQRSADRSWFVHASYLRPHPPWIAPAPYNQLYLDSDIPAPVCRPSKSEERVIHDFFKVSQDDLRIDSFIPGFASSLDFDHPDTIYRIRAIYFALITELDHNIGRIIEFLKQSGQYDDTLIVFTADHGEMLGDRHLWGKETVYDAASHIPLIIRDPACSNAYGRNVDQFTESIDIAPTILESLGGAIPAAMNGVSLSPWLAGEGAHGWRDSIYFELDLANPLTPTPWQKHTGLSLREANVSVLRDDALKLVHFGGGVEPLLFDMRGPLAEQQNLAQDPAFASELLSMTQRMLDHRIRHADHTLNGLTNVDALQKADVD